MREGDWEMCLKPVNRLTGDYIHSHNQNSRFFAKDCLALLSLVAGELLLSTNKAFCAFGALSDTLVSLPNLTAIVVKSLAFGRSLDWACRDLKMWIRTDIDRDREKSIFLRWHWQTELVLEWIKHLPQDQVFHGLLHSQFDCRSCSSNNPIGETK